MKTIFKKLENIGKDKNLSFYLFDDYYTKNFVLIIRIKKRFWFFTCYKEFISYLSQKELNKIIQTIKIK